MSRSDIEEQLIARIDEMLEEFKSQLLEQLANILDQRDDA